MTAMMQWHTLPEQWREMNYERFLTLRRQLIADVIRRTYQNLAGAMA